MDFLDNRFLDKKLGVRDAVLRSRGGTLLLLPALQGARRDGAEEAICRSAGPLWDQPFTWGAVFASVLLLLVLLLLLVVVVLLLLVLLLVLLILLLVVLLFVLLLISSVLVFLVVAV